MTKIPSRVKVGAMTYVVDIVPNMYRDRELYGEVTYADQIITIAGDISLDRQFNTFLHELTHAIMFEAGDTSEQDEQFVRMFSNVLTAVAADNGWTFGGEAKE